MNKYFKSVIALTLICAVIGLALAATNALTAPIIEKNEASVANEALLVVMPDGKDFTPVDLSGYDLPETVTEAYAEAGGGYVVKLTTSGYSTGMVIMCGIDAKGTVTGATCLSSGETLGEEKTYGDKTVGKTLSDIDTVDTVASATKTTAAYRNAVKDALNTAVILGGGSVDLRSEEEILNDSLSEALPTAEGAFTQWFAVEELTDVSAVYSADNGSGYVFVTGEQFVATDSSGTVLSQVDSAVSANISSAAAKVISSSVSELDVSSYELPTAITKVSVTASGNYIFELKASGFGINGNAYYNPSGQPITLRASVTPSGKIIACETLTQQESDGIGSACAEPWFYTQFNGKTETDYKEIDAISGATITTNGYKTAIGKIFEALKILKGEAQ